MVFVNDGRLKIQPHTILFENDGDSALITTTLNDRNREFATRQETGLLPVHSDEIWFRKFAQHALRLQRANHTGHVPAQHQQIERTKSAAQYSVGDVTGTGGSATTHEGARSRASLVGKRGTKVAHTVAANLGNANLKLDLGHTLDRRGEHVHSLEAGSLDHAVDLRGRRRIRDAARDHY